jgi:transcriptional regulator with XRE-family HTH domain
MRDRTLSDRPPFSELLRACRAATKLTQEELAERSHTAYSPSSLAHLHRDQGDLVTARAPLERVVAIRERVLGADHPPTATARRDPADLGR